MPPIPKVASNASGTFPLSARGHDRFRQRDTELADGIEVARLLLSGGAFAEAPHSLGRLRVSNMVVEPIGSRRANENQAWNRQARVNGACVVFHLRDRLASVSDSPAGTQP